MIRWNKQTERNGRMVIERVNRKTDEWLSNSSNAGQWASYVPPTRRLFMRCTLCLSSCCVEHALSLLRAGVGKGALFWASSINRLRHHYHSWTSTLTLIHFKLSYLPRLHTRPSASRRWHSSITRSLPCGSKQLQRWHHRETNVYHQCCCSS